MLILVVLREVIPLRWILQFYQFILRRHNEILVKITLFVCFWPLHLVMRSSDLKCVCLNIKNCHFFFMLTVNASLSLLPYYRCTKVNWRMDPMWQYGLWLCQRNAQFKLSELNWIYSQNFIIQIWLAFWVIVLMMEDKMIPVPTNFILYMSMCQMGIIMPFCQVSMEK